jgi:hypothetical protein
VRFHFGEPGDDGSSDGRAHQSGPDAFTLIQTYEDHFSCSIEWMRLAKEGIFRRRRARRRRPAAPEPGAVRRVQTGGSGANDGP